MNCWRFSIHGLWRYFGVMTGVFKEFVKNYLKQIIRYIWPISGFFARTIAGHPLTEIDWKMHTSLFVFFPIWQFFFCITSSLKIHLLNKFYHVTFNKTLSGWFTDKYLILKLLKKFWMYLFILLRFKSKVVYVIILRHSPAALTRKC